MTPAPTSSPVGIVSKGGKQTKASEGSVKSKAPKGAIWGKSPKGSMESKVPKGAKWGKSPKGLKGYATSAPTASPVDNFELAIHLIETTLDIKGESGDIDEVALQTVTEEYTLAAFKSALTSANVKIVTVTTERRLATMKYIIAITVKYEKTSEKEDATYVKEALKEQVFTALEEDAYVAEVQADESIGATTTGVIVVATPNPAPKTPPTFTPTLPPTTSTTGPQTPAPVTAAPVMPSPTEAPVTPIPTQAPTFKPTVSLTVDDHSDDHTHTPTLDLQNHCPGGNTHTPTVDGQSDDHTHTHTADDHTHTPTVDDH